MCTLSAQAGRAQANAGEGSGESVIVVDLRTGEAADAGRATRTRDRFVAMLATSGAVVPRQDEGLEAALAGALASDGQARTRAARAALDRARNAYGDLDCAVASQEARVAVDELAALQAAGAAVTPALQQAHAYLLSCAHGAGDADAAMAAAYRLQRLAGPGAEGPPPGVSEAVWRAHLPLDATASAQIVELVIDTDPAGAAVWLDHGYLGTAPVRVLAGEGEHILAAAAGPAPATPVSGSAPGPVPATLPDMRSISQRLQVSASDPAAGSIVLSIPEASSPWLAQAEQVARWRSGQEPVDGASLAALMTGLGVRVALVLPGARGAGDDKEDAMDVVEIWALGPGDMQARRVGRGSMEGAGDIAARIAAGVRRWDRGSDQRSERRGPDPDIPLLREDQVLRRADTGAGAQPRAGRKKWWVYATVIGAVVAGGLIIASQDLADDRQYIEVRWP